MQHIDDIIIDIQLQINGVLMVVKNNPPSRVLIQLLSQTCTGVDDRGRRGISAAVDRLFRREPDVLLKMTLRIFQKAPTVQMQMHLYFLF